MTHSLENIVVSTIKPSKKTDHVASIQPSFYDYVCLDGYTPVVFLYKPDKPVACTPSSLLQSLKESLSEVLVPFYPFAGRWVKTQDIRLRELLCNDEGVPFIEASVDADMYSVVNTADFKGSELLGGFRLLGLDPTVFTQKVDFPLPSLFVQVTQFKCGGVAVHVASSHMTADSLGLITFMKAWSEIALQHQTSVEAIHDRSVINSYTTAQLQQFLEMFSPAIMSQENASNGVHHSAPESIQKLLHVKRKVVEELVEEAAKSGMAHLTTTDIIFAHIWRSLYLSSKDQDKDIIRAFSALQCREKGNYPPAPHSYTGCVLYPQAAFPPIPPAELSAESHLQAASLVHKAVTSISPSSVQNLMANFFNPSNWMSGVSLITWSTYPLYEISFGQGYGNPILAISNSTYRVPEMLVAMINPPCPADSPYTIASVLFLLNKEIQEILFSSEHFLSFFH